MGSTLLGVSRERNVYGGMVGRASVYRGAGSGGKDVSGERIVYGGTVGGCIGRCRACARQRVGQPAGSRANGSCTVAQHRGVASGGVPRDRATSMGCAIAGVQFSARSCDFLRFFIFFVKRGGGMNNA